MTGIRGLCELACPVSPRLFEAFVDAYIETIWWLKPEDPEWKTDREFGPGVVEAIVADCLKFWEAGHGIFDRYWTPWQAGHDFWLTRNGHGAGFWDRYLDFRGDEADEVRRRGDELTEICQRGWKESDLYLGDDGKAYLE